MSFIRVGSITGPPIRRALGWLPEDSAGRQPAGPVGAQPDPAAEPPRLHASPGGVTPVPPPTGAWESDEELMRRVQRNDPGAIEQLYERHATRALRVALAECDDPERAEEAVQEAFVRVWRGRMGYRPSVDRFVDWAMAIVRERAIAAARR